MTGIEQAVRRYLSGKHCTLWADFDISSEDGFKRAVQWLSKVWKDVSDIQVAMAHEMIKQVPYNTTRGGFRPDLVIRNHDGQRNTNSSISGRELDNWVNNAPA